MRMVPIRLSGLSAGGPWTSPPLAGILVASMLHGHVLMESCMLKGELWYHSKELLLMVALPP